MLNSIILQIKKKVRSNCHVTNMQNVTLLYLCRTLLLLRAVRVHLALQGLQFSLSYHTLLPADVGGVAAHVPIS